ncbi:MAG TPA: hypothetical protein PLZ57_11000 [Pseudobdellovibrionaceae bacterium]|nr:hypothetical protein [Pseudobdellovibrionaceae bacterium]
MKDCSSRQIGAILGSLTRNIFSVVAGVLAVIATTTAQANSQFRVSDHERFIELRFSGPQAQVLRQILGEDSLLATEVASDSDYSTFRSIRCSEQVCVIRLEGELKRSSDQAPYYSIQFNARLKALKPREALVLAPSMGRDGMISNHRYDSLLVRRLMEESVSQKQIQVRLAHTRLLHADQVAIPVARVSLQLENLKIECHTSVALWGQVNHVNESCSLSSVAQIEAQR